MRNIDNELLQIYLRRILENQNSPVALGVDL